MACLNDSSARLDPSHVPLVLDANSRGGEDAPGSGYQVKCQTIRVGARDYVIRSLLDGQQYSDPHGHAEARGISSASWAHFGQIWGSSLVLAEYMADVALQGQRTLEIGCGLAVPGLVLHQRLVDIVVSDRHPECESFLRENLRLNGLGPLPFVDVDWAGANPKLGRFDLIIGSDILYERGHPRELLDFFDAHGAPRLEVVMVDPKRGQAGEFARRMRERGFSRTAGPDVAGHRLNRYVRE